MGATAMVWLVIVTSSSWLEVFVFSLFFLHGLDIVLLDGLEVLDVSLSHYEGSQMLILAALGPLIITIEALVLLDLASSSSIKTLLGEERLEEAYIRGWVAGPLPLASMDVVGDGGGDNGLGHGAMGWYGL